MLIKHLYTVHQFIETEMAPGYIYADVYVEPNVVISFVQAPFSFDINNDTLTDVVVPMSRGYASGIDTRTPFLAFENTNGILSFSKNVNDQMPTTAGARRAVPVALHDSSLESFVTVNHDTGDGNGADLIHISQSDNLGSIRPNLIPHFPYSESKRASYTDSHSLASGDINGDGLIDVVVGYWRDQGSYALIQTEEGPFKIEHNNFYKTITVDWPVNNKLAGNGINNLLDLHITDVNNDNFGDLIAGWGGGSTSSYIFLNEKASFSTENSIALPDSIYGKDNQQHLKTFSNDFDRDGDQDLLILWSRFHPYYGGQYLQYLTNDGKGNFSDQTTQSFVDPFKDAFLSRLQWSNYWQILDVNNDGTMDIVGVRSASNVDHSQKNGLIYVNDGYGNFSELEFIAPTNLTSSIIQWGDFNNNDKIELLTFETLWPDKTKSFNYFNIYEIDSPLPRLCISNDSDGNAGQAYRLYKAAFDRTPDLKGLGYWIHELENQAPITSVAGNFIISEEFQRLYGVNVSNNDFIRLLYENVLDRSPDQNGYDYWLKDMAKGLTKEEVLISFSESVENKANVADFIKNGIEYMSFIG